MGQLDKVVKSFLCEAQVSLWLTAWSILARLTGMTNQISRELPIGLVLGHGSHKSYEEGMCLMEAVAYVAGEPHSDSPACASPILADIGRRLNDRYNDEERQLLTEMITLLVGTRAYADVELKRSYVMVDAAIREIVPMALEDRGWNDLALRLRAILPIVDRDSATDAAAVTAEVRNQARERRSAAASAYAASAYADADAAAAYAAASAYAASADADADAAYASAAASAASDAAAASAYAASAYAYAASGAAYAYAASDACRPIVLATIAAFKRAILTVS
jgi:hypothetical protein